MIDSPGSKHQTGEHARPLKVNVIGAGIAGLTLSIILRRNGHDVQVGYPNSYDNRSSSSGRFMSKVILHVNSGPPCIWVLTHMACLRLSRLTSLRREQTRYRWSVLTMNGALVSIDYGSRYGSTRRLGIWFARYLQARSTLCGNM